MFMKVNGKEMREVAEVCKYGKMDQSMKDIGKIIWLMALEDLFILMVMCILENGRMIEQMEKANIYLIMGLSILEIGRMISNLDMVKRNGRMVHFTKEIMRLGRSKEKVHLFGVTIVLMKVIFMKIIFMEKGNMFGKMGEFILGNGITIKCMEQVVSHGQMVASTKAPTKTIKSKALVFLHLKMVEFMKENG